MQPRAQHHPSTALDSPPCRPQAVRPFCNRDCEASGQPLPRRAVQQPQGTLRAEERGLEYREGCPPRAFLTLCAWC